MTVNAATLDLITNAEGLRLEAYPDPAHGWSVPTIGVGHTSAAGPPKVTKGMKITRAEAMEILSRDLAAVEKDVLSVVKVPLNDNQFGALVSFTFNVGGGNLRSSTLLKKLNAKDYAGAADEFGRWVYANGTKLAGLVTRRKNERALFLTPSKAAPVPAPTVTKPADFEPPYAPPKPKTLLDWLKGLFVKQTVAGLVSSKGTDMTTWDQLQQIIRIALYVGLSVWLGQSFADGETGQQTISAVLLVLNFVWTQVWANSKKGA